MSTINEATRTAEKHTAQKDRKGFLCTTSKDVEVGDTITIYDPTPQLVMTVEEIVTMSDGRIVATGTTQIDTLAGVRLN